MIENFTTQKYKIFIAVFSTSDGKKEFVTYIPNTEIHDKK